MITSNIIEKRKQKLERLKRVIQQQDNLIKLQERKARTRKLIEWGGLVAKAGLDDFDANTLLGALVDIKEQATSNPKMLDHWSNHGGALFNLDQQNKKAVIVSFKDTVDSDLKLSLRSLGLKWNIIRQEWQGYSDLRKLKELLQETSASIEEVKY